MGMSGPLGLFIYIAGVAGTLLLKLVPALFFAREPK